MDGTRMAEVAAFSEAVDGLYDAATGALDWSDALGRIAVILDSPAGTLNMHDPIRRMSRTVVGEFGTDQSYSDSFNATYGAISPFALVSMMLPEGKAARVYVLEEPDEFFRTRFYKEWCAPQRYREFMGGVFIREPGQLYGIGFVRLDDQPPFSEEDERMLDLLMPHVARAFRISGALATLQGQRDDLLAAIDMLPTPIIVLDADLGIVSINRAAIALSGGEGPFRTMSGSLVLADEAAHAALVTAFAGGRPRPTTLSLEGGLRLSAMLTPYAAPSPRIAALLTIQPTPDMVAPPGLALQQAFGFTNAELRVLLLMLEGGDRGTIARDLGLSLATIKTHIQNLFAKTDTNRQADLVRVVMGGGREHPS
jgi:DNA-binding CsgD family transcriptional regulator/PAS domain-containing protein